LLIALLVAVGIIGYFTVYQTRLRRIRERKLRQSEQQLEKRVSESLDEIGKQYAALREIAEMQSHQVRAPIATILGLINLLNFKDPSDPNNADILIKLKAATEAFDQVIRQIVKMTNEIEGLKPENA
jgi:signal transduction histidine kinase